MLWGIKLGLVPELSDSLIFFFFWINNSVFQPVTVRTSFANIVMLQSCRAAGFSAVLAACLLD